VASDPVQLLIDAGAIPSNPFAANSRYREVGVGLYVRRGDEQGVAYLLRRFIPLARAIDARGEHTVRSIDRPDTLAAELLGDPELYWRVADANGVVDPFELTDTVGARVRIPSPIGF